MRVFSMGWELSLPTTSLMLHVCTVQFTRRSCFNFTDLLPYREYRIDVLVSNEYTALRFLEDVFDTNVIILTAEGGL